MNKLRNPENGQYVSKKKMPDVDANKVIDIWFGGEELGKTRQDDLEQVARIVLYFATLVLVMVGIVYLMVRI